jgi:hypothetical protein
MALDECPQCRALGYLPEKDCRSDRDPAGEIGITEWDDETAELGNEGLRDLFSREPVWPALAPDDPHSYIALAQRVGVACGLILYGGACLALGYFIGWAVWGQ